MEDWRLRFAPGLSRRANSANPRRAEFRNLQAGMAEGAAQYRARGLPAIFRVPSFVDPAVDQHLQALGYSAEGETITLYGHRDAVIAEADGEVELRPAPAQDWLAAMVSQQGYSQAQEATYRRIVSRVTAPAAFAGLRQDGGYVALAFGVVVNDIHICESVVTSAAHRRRGYAQRVLAALHGWAVQRGARHFCLQVEATNTPAVHLYRGLGLAGDLYRYHYRREPVGR